MYIKDIQLINFKNYSERAFAFSQGVNCIVGLNGVGKTNLLDAIHYLSMTKSYFNNVDYLSIRHEEDFFAVHGNFVIEEVEGSTRVSCIQQKDKRKIVKINQKEYERLAEHIGNYPSVMISPYDTDYINGNSDVRRKYFDSTISQFDKIYLENLIHYNKILQHRNALLKHFSEKNFFNEQEISIWNDKLVEYGTKIFEKRKQFLEDFLPVFNRFFSAITPDEKISIEYKSQLLEDDFFNLLKINQQKDFLSQHSSVGIHKDDFLFAMNRFSVKKFCSQGQQKSFLVVLKLAQYEYIKQIKGKKPLLLLDDVFDKLDQNRIAQLIALVADNHFGQVFITDTHKERIMELFNGKNIDYLLIEV
jgi:DNA replication and repair protein RecF